MKYRFEGQGVVSLPGSKSLTIRALIIATHLKTPLKLTNFPECNDTLTLVSALQTLGFSFQFGSEKDLYITPPKKIILNPIFEIMDSAAALRFLLVRLAGIQGLQGVVKLSPQLQKRPILPLPRLIKSMGGRVEHNNGTIHIFGTSTLTYTPETGNLLSEYQQVSSQFLSAILLSLPMFQNKNLDITIPSSQVSYPYLEITLEIMKKFGIAYVRKDNSISLNNAARTYINPEEYQIEPDYSAACYFWALGALSSESIGVKVSSDNSSQGDFNFLKILKEMGAEINYEEGLISVKKSTLKGVRCSMKEMPDQVPTLAVLALFADTPTEIYDIDYLKYKESDRISSLCIELSKLGVQIYYSDGALTVHPLVSAPQKATLHTFQDHRLVMAFSVLTSMFPQITITDKQCVAKSFPDFFTELDKLKPLSQ